MQHDPMTMQFNQSLEYIMDDPVSKYEQSSTVTHHQSLVITGLSVIAVKK